MSPTIKSKCKPKAGFIYLSLLLCTWLMTGCLSRQEGCLDIAAVNFDFSADRACNECCTYPMMTIVLSQKWSEGNFSTADTLFDKNGKPYLITDLNYYLSSWSWVDENQEVYTVDSSSIPCATQQINYTPDILVIDPQQFIYSLGTIRQSPTIQSIQFKFGITPGLECVDASLSTTPFPLSASSPLRDPDTTSRAALRLILRRDLATIDMDTIFLYDCLSQQVHYPLDSLLVFPPAMDPAIKLTVNYALWFKDADVNDLSSFGSSIRANVNESIFPTP